MVENIENPTNLEPSLRLRTDVETVLSWAVLAIIFMTRITNLHYNTLFVDEAIYPLVGQGVLTGASTQDPMSWMAGSYLYPLVAAWVNTVGGVFTLRLLSAILVTIAAWFVLWITRIVVDQRAGLWAVLLFGFTPVSINVGQLAVYDAPAVPLLAAALFFLVTAAYFKIHEERRYLLAAAVCFSASVLFKYVTVLYGPALLLVASLLYIVRGRSLKRLGLLFVGPVLVILGVFSAIYRAELVILFTGEWAFQAASRWAILRRIAAELWIVGLFSGGGLAILLWKRTKRFSRRQLIGLLLLGQMALVAIYAAPLYHLITGNVRSADKHTIYTLLFIAPLAGYCISSVIEYVRRSSAPRRIQYRFVGAALSIIVLIWAIDYGLDLNWGFQHSWPNASSEISYLQAQHLKPDQRVLAEGKYIYQYYLNIDPAQSQMWDDTWFLSYAGQQGVPAMQAAIDNHWFAVVILNDFYTPGLRAQLEPQLFAAGYTIGHEDTQQLGSGETILTRVYVVSK